MVCNRSLTDELEFGRFHALCSPIRFSMVVLVPAGDDADSKIIGKNLDLFDTVVHRHSCDDSDA